MSRFGKQNYKSGQENNRREWRVELQRASFPDGVTKGLATVCMEMN